MSDTPTCVYVNYIAGTPEQVWHALTDAERTAEYWGHSNVSDWQVGSAWEHRRMDGTGRADVVGTVVESVAPTRLVTTWSDPGGGEGATSASLVSFDVEPYGKIVRLTVAHANLEDSADHAEAAAGWAAVLSNLKSLTETGHALPETPWEMPRWSG